jgi:SulP family sulfate permease
VSVLGSLRSLAPSRADYRDVPRTWKSDVLAGLTVGIVALPLALAFGVSSGVGAQAGLITAVVAGFLAAVFGGSNVQVSGPTGAMVVVLAPIVAANGAASVVVVGFLAGFIVVLMGLLKLGRSIEFIPWAVLEGFTLGIAVIIFMQQIPAAVGSPHFAESTNASVSAWLAVSAAVSAAGTSAATAVVATSSALVLGWSIASVATVVLIMALSARWIKVIPGSILAIVVVTVVAELSAAPLARIGELPSSLGLPSSPDFGGVNLGALLGPALTVAALAAIESLLSARVAAEMAPTGVINPDRELVGQGIASIGSALFGGMPATGAIARTAVNVRSGGRTRLAAIVHAAVLLGVVYLATGPVSRIPLAALAGVLMVTAVRMVPMHAITGIFRTPGSSTVVFIVTALITVAFDLVLAVTMGIALSYLASRWQRHRHITRESAAAAEAAGTGSSS